MASAPYARPEDKVVVLRRPIPGAEKLSSKGSGSQESTEEQESFSSAGPANLDELVTLGRARTSLLSLSLLQPRCARSGWVFAGEDWDFVFISRSYDDQGKALEMDQISDKRRAMLKHHRTDLLGGSPTALRCLEILEGTRPGFVSPIERAKGIIKIDQGELYLGLLGDRAAAGNHVSFKRSSGGKQRPKKQAWQIAVTRDHIVPWLAKTLNDESLAQWRDAGVWFAGSGPSDILRRLLKQARAPERILESIENAAVTLGRERWNAQLRFNPELEYFVGSRSIAVGPMSVGGGRLAAIVTFDSNQAVSWEDVDELFERLGKSVSCLTVRSEGAASRRGAAIDSIGAGDVLQFGDFAYVIRRSLDFVVEEHGSFLVSGGRSLPVSCESIDGVPAELHRMIQKLRRTPEHLRNEEQIANDDFFEEVIDFSASKQDGQVVERILGEVAEVGSDTIDLYLHSEPEDSARETHLVGELPAAAAAARRGDGFRASRQRLPEGRWAWLEWEHWDSSSGRKLLVERGFLLDKRAEGK
jgi:hypothetical protein